ncbi:Uncharacterised protein [Bordetella pertussis]|nr:Uncharacterised protein [Bordetella pertussis]
MLTADWLIARRSAARVTWPSARIASKIISRFRSRCLAIMAGSSA